jgi:hypothetical protein
MVTGKKDFIEMGNGMSLRPLDDPLMGRIHHTTHQVLKLVSQKAARPPANSDPTVFALNVLVSALSAVTDQVRKSDVELHKRCLALIINRLTMDVQEIQSLLSMDGRADQ